MMKNVILKSFILGFILATCVYAQSADLSETEDFGHDTQGQAGAEGAVEETGRPVDSSDETAKFKNAIQNIVAQKESFKDSCSPIHEFIKSFTDKLKPVIKEDGTINDSYIVENKDELSRKIIDVKIFFEARKKMGFDIEKDSVSEIILNSIKDIELKLIKAETLQCVTDESKTDKSSCLDVIPTNDSVHAIFRDLALKTNQAAVRNEKLDICSVVSSPTEPSSSISGAVSSGGTGEDEEESSDDDSDSGRDRSDGDSLKERLEKLKKAFEDQIKSLYGDVSNRFGKALGDISKAIKENEEAQKGLRKELDDAKNEADKSKEATDSDDLDKLLPLYESLLAPKATPEPQLSSPQAIPSSGGSQGAGFQPPSVQASERPKFDPNQFQPYGNQQQGMGGFPGMFPMLSSPSYGAERDLPSVRAVDVSPSTFTADDAISRIRMANMENRLNASLDNFNRREEERALFGRTPPLPPVPNQIPPFQGGFQFPGGASMGSGFPPAQPGGLMTNADRLRSVAPTGFSRPPFMGTTNFNGSGGQTQNVRTTLPGSGNNPARMAEILKNR